MAEMVRVTIDGQPYEVEKGIPVLLAAERAGVRIPHICYYEGTSVFAGCRVCVVQIEGARGMPTSCTTPTAEGQVIWTKTPDVLEMQRSVMSLIMADHPDRCLTCHRQKHCGINDVCLRDSVVTYRCLTCAKNKRCEFQSATEELEMFRYPMRYYQEDQAWYGPGHVDTPIRRDNPFIELDFNECILCARCVRTCDEIRGLGCYELSRKGPATRIDTSFGLPLQAVGCDACGACIDACPVNTIMDRPSKWAGPSQRTVTTTCPHCGDGCQLDVETKRDKLLRVVPNKEGPANHGFASARGRYGLGYIQREDRLRSPLIRRDGVLQEASWEEALDLAASHLARHRGPAFGAIASPKATNEELYALQKFARHVMGSPHIDHYARLDERELMRPVMAALGYPAMTNSMDDLAEARCVLILGSDTSVTHPVAAWRVRQMARFKGGTLIVADPRQTEMTNWAHIWLRYRPGTEASLVAGLIRAVLDEGMLDQAFLSTCEGFEQLQASVRATSVDGAATACGLDPEELRRAARSFAAGGPSTALFDAGLAQYTEDGVEAVKGLVDLCLLTGNLGRAGAGLASLRGAANQQGADDLGCRPDLLPGYLPAPDGGHTARAMLRGESTVQAMLIAGVDPLADDPDRGAMKAALQELDFRIVFSEFLTATTAVADVVLPIASFAEQDGTFTSTERRVQCVNQVFPPLEGCRAGWDVVGELAGRLGSSFGWQDAAAVLREIADTVAGYAGITSERLAAGEAPQWPCPSPEHPGTPLLYAAGFSDGKPHLLPLEGALKSSSGSGQYPFLLASGRELMAYHKEVLTVQEDPTTTPLEQALRIHPDDGERVRLEEGAMARVITEDRDFLASVHLAPEVPQGAVYLTAPLLEDTGPMQEGGARHLPEVVRGSRVVPARIEPAP